MPVLQHGEMNRWMNTIQTGFIQNTSVFKMSPTGKHRTKDVCCARQKQLTQPTHLPGTIKHSMLFTTL
jgi:hypothetical protein